MKKFKKALAVVLSVMFVALAFAGCSSSDNVAAEITDETMLVAYTAESKPFLYKDENGKFTGFDAEIFDNIFKSIKNDYKNYQFVQVDEDYEVGEDVAYTDDDGNEYIAYVMLGGVQTNSGSFNGDHSFTDTLIENRVVTVTASDSSIKTNADLNGKTVGSVGDLASQALDKNASIKNGLKAVKTYENTAEALTALSAGEVDAVVVDEFNFEVSENKADFTVIDGELDVISYVFATKKHDELAANMNEAVYELKNYGDTDEFTPIVEKYFGYDASNFTYVPESN